MLQSFRPRIDTLTPFLYVDKNTYTFIDEDGGLLFMRLDRTAMECFVYEDIVW